jgi:hypothetical protein
MAVRNLGGTAPLAYFLWMLRQSVQVYTCEPSVAMTSWDKLSAKFAVWQVKQKPIKLPRRRR